MHNIFETTNIEKISHFLTNRFKIMFSDIKMKQKQQYERQSIKDTGA